MVIELVKDAARFSSLRSEWDALFAHLHDDSSVFGTFAWYECWWRHFSKNAELFMLMIRDGEKLVGIAPLMCFQATLHGLPVRLIGFIENGNSLHNDMLIEPYCREEALRQLLRFLFGHRKSWDAVVLKNVPATSVNYATLTNILEEMRVKWDQKTSYITPHLFVDKKWSEYYARFSPRTRKTLRNIQNCIKNAGEYTVTNVRTFEEFLSVKDEVFDVARRSWTEKIGNSLASHVNKDFFVDLSNIAAMNGWLSLWTLQLNGRIIAFEYHLGAYGKQHAMRASFDAEYSSLSPGTFLEMQILEKTFDESGAVLFYDFGGDFDDYKKKWTNDSTRHCTISFFNDRIHSRTAAFHEMITINALRNFRNQFREIRFAN